MTTITINDLITNSTRIRNGVYKTIPDYYLSLYAHKGNAFFWQKGTLKQAKQMLNYAKILTNAELFHPATEWGIYTIGNEYSIYSIMIELQKIPYTTIRYGSEEAAERIINYFNKNNIKSKWHHLTDIPDSSAKENWGLKENKTFMIDIDALDIELSELNEFLNENNHLLQTSEGKTTLS